MTPQPKSAPRVALSRAREKAALDWYAQKFSSVEIVTALGIFYDWQGMKDSIKDIYAIAQGFDSWDEFCKSDDPERWTK